MVKHLDWHGLYGDGWKGEIVADAFTHPAKYSRALIRHIYEYLIKEKMVKPGDVVLDPFGGVALGGLDAARLGLHFIGCELESKFVDLGNQNIALWNSRYAGKMPRWGSARLVQGDSRHLRSVIAQASAAVSSPPYSESLTYQRPGAGGEGNELMRQGFTVQEIAEMRKNNNPRILETRRNAGYSRSPANLGNLPEGDYRAAISSPPYADARISESGEGGNAADMRRTRGSEKSRYGATVGQLGTMKGDGYEAAVSSPPYNLPMSQDHNGTRGGKRGTTPAEQGAFVKYGNTDGQIEGLPMSEEGFSAAVSSPPYEATRVVNGEAQRGDISTIPEFIDSYGAGSFRRNHDGIGDFWSAARQVVTETYAVLAPGAVAVWVVKDFIRNKARVPFCDQWQQLCEACGFSTYAIARAWLVEDHGTQLAMDGNHKHKRTERKSFFRRLSERKGSPRIDFETVLVMRKPEAAS